MKQTLLQILVTEAVGLDRDIAEKTERLKELKTQLIGIAGKHEAEHLTTANGGSSWTANGTDGCIARVSFPAPTLKSKIDAEGKPIEAIRKLAGKCFDRLFTPLLSYKPVPDFRNEAQTLLAKADATKLIKLCQTDSNPRVSFETTDHEVTPTKPKARGK